MDEKKLLDPLDMATKLSILNSLCISLKSYNNNDYYLKKINT